MRFLALDVHAFNRVRAPYRLPLHNQGLVLVEGENRDGGAVMPSNGAGKSLCLVETLMWGLFGKMVRYGEAQVTTAAVHPGRGADVCVQVQLHGVTYQLQRTRTPTGAPRFTILALDPETETFKPLPLSKDAAQRSAEASALLGLDYTAFRYAVVVQGALAADGFARQMAVLETLLRLDELGAASDLARQRAVEGDRALAAARAELGMAERAAEEVGGLLAELQAAEQQAEQRVAQEEAQLQEQIERAQWAAGVVPGLQDTVAATRAAGDRARQTAAVANGAITPLVREKQKVETQQRSLVCEACKRPFGSPEELARARAKAEKQLAKLTQDINKLYGDKEKADREAASLALKLTGQERELRERQREADGLAGLLGRRAGLATVLAEQAAQRKAVERRVAESELRVEQLRVKVQGLVPALARVQYWTAGYGRDGLQADLFAAGVPELNRAAQWYSDVLTGGGFRISFNTQRDSQRETLVRIEGASAPTYEGLSRGEKERTNLVVALSLRALARWRAAEPINVSIFDEVFDHVDPGGLKAIADQLAAEVQATGGSIYVITHNPSLKALFSGARLVRVVREGGEATVLYA